MKPIHSILGALLLYSFSCFADSTPKDSLRTKSWFSKSDSIDLPPFQVSFIYPLGTNGVGSSEIVNYLSFNLIAGYNGGLEGLELGGFANILKWNAEGIQVGGFGNVVMGELEGIQIAGFGNLVGKGASGMQIGGFTNHTQRSSAVLQIGGFSNQVMGSLIGGQISGFGNYAADSLQGFQISGFANYAGNESEAVQIAGFGNVCKSNLEGIQVSGFANVCEDISGVQIAGFMNRAAKVEGLQIGLINIADTFTSGFPIGLISNVKNGYRAYSLGVNELQWIEAEMHLGVPQFYNILSLAGGPMNGSSSWGFGYGLGSKMVDHPKYKLAMEGLVYHVNEQELWSNVNNLLIRLQPKFEYHPKAGRFALWAGPSANLLISGLWDNRGDAFESELAPYTALSDEDRYNTYDLWFGGQAGIKF